MFEAIRTPLRVLATIHQLTVASVCAVSIVRLKAILTNLPDPDFTWRGFLINQIWWSVPNPLSCNHPRYATWKLLTVGNSLLEMYTGIVCACLPCLTPLIKRHFPGFFAPGQGRQLTSLEALSTTWRQTASDMTVSGLREDLQWHERRMTTIGHTSDRTQSRVTVSIC